MDEATRLTERELDIPPPNPERLISRRKELVADHWHRPHLEELAKLTRAAQGAGPSTVRSCRPAMLHRPGLRAEVAPAAGPYYTETKGPPKEHVVLMDSPIELTFIDNGPTWRDFKGKGKSYFNLVISQFQSLEHFVGCLIILSMTFKLILILWNRFFRHWNIRKHGYPPAHCDADGDFNPAEKVENKFH